MKNKIVKRLLITIAIFITLFAVITVTGIWLNKRTSIEITEPGVIEFTGSINFENYEAFMELIKTSTEPIKWVELESGGGNAFAGILIGRAIHKHKLKVYVPKKCISACANYIFPAGKKKAVGKNAVIVYHGGLQQDNLLDIRVKLFKNNKVDNENKGKEASVRKASKNEAELQNKYFPDHKMCDSNKFSRENPEIAAKQCIDWQKGMELEHFELINMDPLTPYYGQRGEYKENYESYKYSGFYYDLNTLANLLNTKKIRVRGKKDWNPSKNRYVKNDRIYKVDILESNES